MDPSHTTVLYSECDIVDEGVYLNNDPLDISISDLGIVVKNGEAGSDLASHVKDARHSQGLLKCSGDSGFSSRMSEASTEERVERAAPLLAAEDGKVLRKRLTRISECQYEEPCGCAGSTLVKAGLKLLGVVCLLYIFICTLDMLSNSFKLLGGKTAGSVFNDSELLRNPITGLMIGVLSTVILQSSSTSSSIVITMVASKIIDIQPAIPIIMGVNIGTTVTNTLVSLAHSMDRREFKRAFSGAVVHDVFNWLTVLILLPLQYGTGVLYHFTKLIVDSLDMEEMKYEKQDLLKTLTKPVTKRIVILDKSVITGVAEGKTEYLNQSILKVYCTFDTNVSYAMVNISSLNNITGNTDWSMVNSTVETKIPRDTCDALFSQLAWSDSASGLVLFISSIVMLSLCLFSLVKVLHSLLGGHIAKAARKTINADFPHPFGWLTGYVAIILGAGMTILVQSSSVFTSALTPLVGIGCLKLERMLPLTLGSNIGTTFTGILAALAADSSTMKIALQLAFCHLFFNIFGIALFYPIPRMRAIVINTAKYLGKTTAQYRWFAVAYLILMFFCFPGFFFLVSFAGKIVFIVTLCIISVIAIFVICLNFMHGRAKLKKALPNILKTWEFLPEFMRSLAPYDRCLTRAVTPLTKFCCQCCVQRCTCISGTPDGDAGYLEDSDSDDSSDNSVMSTRLNTAVSSRTNLSDNRKMYKPVKVTISENKNAKQSPTLSKKSSTDNTKEHSLVDMTIGAHNIDSITDTVV